MSIPLHLLILEDREADAELMLHELHTSGFDPQWQRVETEADFLAHLDPGLEVILADYSLPQFDALRALHLLVERDLDIPLIVVSGSISEEVAVECMKQGAADYILKDRLARLGQAVARAMEDKRLRVEHEQAEHALKNKMEQLVALNQASQAVATSLDLDQVLVEVMSLASKVVGSDFTSVVLVDEAGRISRGIENLSGVVSIDFRVRKKGFTSWIIRSRRPVVVDEIGKDGSIKPRVGAGAPHVANPRIVTMGIQSFVGLPLMIEDHIVGVLYLHSLRPANFRDQLTLLTTFASQSAIALEKARLYAAVQNELSERERVEQALRESEQRYRDLVELSPDAIFIEEKDGEIVFINAAGLKLFGAAGPEQILGKRIFDFIHPDYRPVVTERFRALINNKKEVPLEEEKYVRLDGTSVYAEVAAISFPYEGKSRVQVIARNITERKQAAEELARQTEELRQRNEELARLYRASDSLISGTSLNTQEQAGKIVDVVQKEFGQHNCSLLIPRMGSNELIRLVTVGPYANQVKNAKLTLDGPGLVPQAMRLGETINIPDVSTAPDYHQSWEAARSELVIPLKIGSTVIGVIDVQSSKPGAFSPDDEHLMGIFAERAALALEHSRLNSQTETRMQQLVALRKIDMAISSSFDINMTLGVLLDQVIGQLGAHAADILIFNGASQTFKFSCERGFRVQTLRHVQLQYGAGYVWRAVRERQVIDIPDIHAGPDGLQRSPDLSAEQFVTYTGIPLTAKGQIKGVLEIFHRDPIKLEPESFDFLETLAGQAAIAIDNAELFDNLQISNSEMSMAYEKTLEGWAHALELRDHDTEGHTSRTTELTVRLARAMGVNEKDLVYFYRGALLHDIGKIGVPDSIVLKPGPLNDDEWVIMRKHPQYAYDMLSSISYLRQSLDIPYCHHEKWDGTGYPRGLKGGQIPLSARIFAIVDVWDALTSDRPYRKAWPKDKARQYILEQAGLQFDPDVVKIFMKEISSSSGISIGDGLP